MYKTALTIMNVQHKVIVIIFITIYFDNDTITVCIGLTYTDTVYFYGNGNTICKQLDNTRISVLSQAAPPQETL